MRARLSFGIGGYKGGIDRKYLATVSGDFSDVSDLSSSLSDVGFWTVFSVVDEDESGTIIEVGETITQRM